MDDNLGTFRLLINVPDSSQVPISLELSPQANDPLVWNWNAFEQRVIDMHRHDPQRPLGRLVQITVTAKDVFKRILDALSVAKMFKGPEIQDLLDLRYTGRAGYIHARDVLRQPEEHQVDGCYLKLSPSERFGLMLCKGRGAKTSDLRRRRRW